MNLTPAAVLMVAIIVQAIVPRVRVPVMLLAAALSMLAVALGGADDVAVRDVVHGVVSGVPWDVLILLVALGVTSQIFAEARAFERLAVFAAKHGGADPARVVVVFAVVMYVVSGVVNNLTALLLVLPVLLVLLKLTGTTERHARWLIGVLLVACNLGGAATPIGDFPAILLLGAGAMDFVPYLTLAVPLTSTALLVLLVIVWLWVRPARDVSSSSLAQRVTVDVVVALHRHVHVQPATALPAAVSLAAMLVVWTAVPASTAPPELVAWLGATTALLCLPRRAALILRRAVDVEAALFLFALFVCVGCVQRTGMFDALAQGLLALPVSPATQLAAFLVVAGVLTGLFSAGPSMAGLLVVAKGLTATLPADVVYVGLALSVCAGSSLFLTAATAGPLAQGMVGAAGVNDVAGRPVRFSFSSFLPTGVLSFVVIQGTAVAWAMIRVL